MKPARRSRERGSSLLLAVLLFVAIFGIAALTIDLGFARLTQDEMQTAADASSLDGLRFAAAQDRPTGAGAAQSVAALTFTDPSGQTMQGPGPEVELDAGITEAHASQDITNEGVAAPPQLQVNAANLTEGDIVTGAFADDPSVPYSQLEAADYTRADFTAALPSATPSALVVRLRRVSSVVPSATPSALDNTPGVSSSGTAVPFLFGHGAFIHGTGSDADYTVYSPLRDGIKVRATAIATLAIAMSVGVSGNTLLEPNGTTVVLPGATTFAIARGDWTGVATGVPCVSFTPAVLSAWAGSPRVGDQITVGGSVPPTGAPAPGYVPIYETLTLSSGQQTVIVGFAAVDFQIEADGAHVDFTVIDAGLLGLNACVAADGLWAYGYSSADVVSILGEQQPTATTGRNKADAQAPLLRAPAQAR